MPTTVTPNVVESNRSRDVNNHVYTTTGSLTYFNCAAAANITDARQRIKFLSDSEDAANYTGDDLGDLTTFKLFGNVARDPAATNECVFSNNMTIRSLCFQNVGITEGVWVDISNVGVANTAAIAAGVLGLFFIPDGGMMEFCVKSHEHITFITSGSSGNVLVVARL